MVETTKLHDLADGRIIASCEWGVPDGIPVIFFHGTYGGRLFRHARGEYERLGLRVITYDRPGFGRSTRQPGRSVADAKDDVASIADSLGIGSFAVLGVSGGGPYALAMGALLPDRVTRCATVVSGAPMDAEGLDFFAGMDGESRSGWQSFIDRGEADLLEDYEAVMAEVHSPTREPIDGLPADIDELLATAVRDALAPGPGGYIDDNFAELMPYGFNIREVTVPTRMLLARDDGGVPAAHGQWLLQQLPRGELIWVDGGHMGPRLEEEEELLAWLADRQTRP